MVAAQDGAMDGFAVTVTLTVNVMLSVTVSLSRSVCLCMCVSMCLCVCVCLCVLFGQLAAPEQHLTRHDNWAAGDLWLTRV